jgi:hypothetical protein
MIRTHVGTLEHFQRLGLWGRQIFIERFADGVLAPSARRTARLDGIIYHLELALGGRPAASFAKRLMFASKQ